MRRELFVGRGLEEAATVWNRSDREVEAVLELELASDFADIFAVKRVEDLGAPGHLGGGAVATGALAGRTHRRVRGRRLPGADARASVTGARRGRRRRRALPVATRARRALAARRRGAVAPERDAGARRCRVRGGAARRSTRAGRVARRVVALGAAAAGARRSRRSSGPGRIRSPTWRRCGCAGRGAAWCRRRGCRGS